MASSGKEGVSLTVPLNASIVDTDTAGTRILLVRDRSNLFNEDEVQVLYVTILEF